MSLSLGISICCPSTAIHPFSTCPFYQRSFVKKQCWQWKQWCFFAFILLDWLPTVSVYHNHLWYKHSGSHLHPPVSKDWLDELFFKPLFSYTQVLTGYHLSPWSADSLRPFATALLGPPGEKTLCHGWPVTGSAWPQCLRFQTTSYLQERKEFWFTQKDPLFCHHSLNL